MKQLSHMYKNGWSRYPVSRPVKGKAVEVAVFDLDNAVLIIGQGVGSERKDCGDCISINGITIDSNREVLWKYVE